jgi:predicted transcriptional regulator
MSTLELRHIITEQLSKIDDESFLSALKVIIESKISGIVYELSDFQKERINLARHELKNGQTVTHEDIQKEIDQWLSRK